MSEEEARAEIVRILREKGYYAILWDGHWGKYFVVVKPAEGSDKQAEIYGAFMEMYYDVIGGDTSILHFNLPPDSNGWTGLLGLVGDSIQKFRPENQQGKLIIDFPRTQKDLNEEQMDLIEL